MSTARKPGTLHRLGLGAAILAVAAAPLALALPASATTSANGCLVKPLRPTVTAVVGGVKQIRYNVDIACNGGRTIEVQQSLFEADTAPNVDDFDSTSILSRTFVGPDIVTRGATEPLQNTEGGQEEVFQKARFRVSVGGGPVSAWTAFESGPVLTVSN